MFDIICCEADPKDFGFERFFLAKEAKITDVDNLQSAVKFKNKKVLIRLRDHSFDEGAIKLIAEKKKACFLIDLSRIINGKGFRRSIEMSKLRTFLSLCVHHGAYYAFASFAEKNEIRTSDELCNIAMLFDLNRGQAKFALKMVQHYL
jgi:RNase P/RNase MRP subunit p30